MILIFFLIAGLTYSYARYAEPFWLAEKEEEMRAKDAGLSAPLTIGVFSDTHFGEFYSVEKFEKVIEKINAASPDIVVFLGDLIDYYDRYEGNVAEISGALSRIQAPLGKYAVYGNHDYGGGAQNAYRDVMTAGGFQVLVNEYVLIEQTNLAITGIDDFVIGYGTAEAAGYAPADAYNLVLCHEPDIIDQLLDYNVDLMLSGHTHGGQINLPFLSESYLPAYGEKYLRGLFTFDNANKSLLYVNSGVGMTKMPYRFMARPEITYIRLV